ncbi:MAG: rRNA pseudouridine synthase [Lachnospiraceae bacterium]|nr:rRNA pseudouridine synthase [Lachnospiraceae bacterium]
MEAETVRINKYLAEAGVCSRREADKLIEKGQVAINGQPAEAGQRVGRKDTVTLRGKRVGGPEKKVVLAYYKPVGVTCTERDVHAEKTVIEDLGYPIRVTYAGRLDKDSEGLLLMTNDGRLIEQLMRGANHCEKEYIVKVDKELKKDFCSVMEKGIYLKELDRTTRECRVEILGARTFRIILTEGLNRQIRRMCGSLGYRVRRIKRVRIAGIHLADLKPGEYRSVTERELGNIMMGSGGEA